MRTKLGIALVVAGAAALVGCTRVVVRKDPGPHDTGFRYWRPKPYLFIGPAAQPAKSGDGAGSAGTPDPKKIGDAAKEAYDKAKDNPEKAAAAAAGKAAAEGGGTFTDNNFVKVAMEIKYLPDYNEEYSVKLKPGIGVGQLSFTLQDGWNLTTVGLQSDQKIPELINSLANVVGAVRGGGGGAAPATKAANPKGDEFFGAGVLFTIDARPDVPLGFYEPIIATDPHGRKSLFGWRYVGFLPFAGCPVEACVRPDVVTCETGDLWGLVATPNSIKFQRLADIQDPERNWPYRYKEFTPYPGNQAPPPGPLPQTVVLPSPPVTETPPENKKNPGPAQPAPAPTPVPPAAPAGLPPAPRPADR